MPLSDCVACIVLPVEEASIGSNVRHSIFAFDAWLHAQTRASPDNQRARIARHEAARCLHFSY
jgi:hypothetical protein